MPDHGILYHLVPKAKWEELKTTQTKYFPPTYEQDGFIHLTKEAELLLKVANHFYTDVVGDYIVLSIESSKLTSEVKFEPAADVGNKKSEGLGEDDKPLLFPHLYGTVDFESVAKELPVKRNEAGKFLSIQFGDV
eukprot:gene12995-15357_t